MKVLIVDDESHVREGIKLLGAWEQNGISEIYEAGNGEEAIALIQRYHPEIIFSDMKMPRMDGTGLLEWIKENQPSSKTIVVTGYDDYHYMRKAIHFGSLDYLLKPIDPDMLNQTLEKAVNVWNKEEADRKLTESLMESFQQARQGQLSSEMIEKLDSGGYMQEMPTTAEANTQPNFIFEIEKYLQANFDRDVKLQEISEHFYLSREYISRKFKQEFNVNISDYIVKIRIDKAKTLLKNSQLRIYEIANIIGYQDDKYFRKVFKKVEGITPNEYRALYV